MERWFLRLTDKNFGHATATVNPKMAQDETLQESKIQRLIVK